jgi:dGTPase
VERFLDQELAAREMGRFLHNEQSVRVVDFIERRSDKYHGLNLTTEVREGILKHNKDYSDIYLNLNPSKPCSFLEGQVVSLVDTLAYICHDLQDGIESGLIEKSMRSNPDFQKDIEEMLSIIRELTAINIDFNKLHDTFFIDKLIHSLVMSVTEQSALNLEHYKVEDSEHVSELSLQNIKLISLGDKEKELFKRLKGLVYETVYGINTIQIMDSKAVMVISDLFQAFINNPKLLPPDTHYKYRHIEQVPNYKGFVNNEVHVICDYLASMTDRFALEEHERIRNPRIKI